MATKTFEELRKLAIQIRDEKANKQNTALRIGNFLLSSLDKMESMDIADIAEAVLQAETAADEAKRQADIVAQSGDIVEEAIKQGAAAEAAAAAANAAADKATNEGLFKTQQDLSEEEQGQVKRNLGIEDLMASLETQTIEGFSETVNATTSTKSVDNIIPPFIDFAIVDLGSTDGRELPTTPSMSVVLAKVTDDGRVKMQGYLKTSHEEYNIQVVSGSAEKYALNVNIITDIETTYKVFQIRYLSTSDGGKFKGSYGELSQLQAAYPTAGNGSYAFVGNPRHLYEWNSNAWTDKGEFITNVDQVIDAQSERAISNKAVSAKLTELDGKINGIKIESSKFVIGLWQGDNSPTETSTEGYLRSETFYNISTDSDILVSLYDANKNKVRLSDYGLIIKFTDSEGNKVNSSYQNTGMDISVQGNAKRLYIHAETEKINAVNGFYLLGLYNESLVDYITNTDNRLRSAEVISTTALNNSNNALQRADELNKNLKSTESVVINSSDYVTGLWQGDNPPIGNSTEGYLRCNMPYDVDTSESNIISMLDLSGHEVRIGNYGLTIKFTDANNAKVSWVYEDGGNKIKVQGNANRMYIHATEDKIEPINGFMLSGLYSKKTIDYINKINKEQEELKSVVDNTTNKVNELYTTTKLSYTPTSILEVFPNKGYVGSSLNNQPSNLSGNSCIEVLDVSSVPDDTVIYATNLLNENLFDGCTFKYYGEDNNQISTSWGSDISTGNRGYKKPSGAVKLGMHYINSRIEGDITQFLKSLKIYNIPYIQKSVFEQIDNIKEDIEIVEERVTSLEKKKSSSYKDVLKILFIGSSFGVDTIREVGNICKSYGIDVVLGNAYIGAGTLDTFLGRWNKEQGVTYYKWKYQATDWEQYNGTTGKWSSEPNSDITDEGEPVPADNTVMMDWILSDEAWDFVILQNGAYQSPYPDQSVFWEKGEDGNITKNIVQELIDKCKKTCLYSNPVFGMNMTWAFSVYHTISEQHGTSGTNNDRWLDYGSNQKERQIGMWTNIAKNYKDCIANCPDVKFVIPSGTTIQNARTNLTLRNSTIYTSAVPTPPSIEQAEAVISLDGIESTYPFMDNVANWKYKTDFTRDSIHADFGITRYMIAGTLFQTFISKIFNLDIEDCTYRISDNTLQYTPVTEDNIILINKCIKEACNKPFEITTIES